MKSIKIIVSILFVLFIGISSALAQESIAMENLTEAQNELLLAQRKLIKENRETIKASLTTEQLEIRIQGPGLNGPYV